MTNKLTEKQLSTIRNLIKAFDFKKLFNQLGWDNTDIKQTIAIKDNTYPLTAIAEKRGFIIFTCQLADIPNQTERKKIAQQIAKRHQEHLIIYFNAKKQIWQISVRELNKPIQYKETEYYSHQQPELLISRLKGIFFTLDEEENIHLIDVTQRIKTNFNNNTEKTTKKFYDDFKKQHGAFMTFIQGITDSDNQRQYASLMLNRLMFIYFIQKKGFLDNDIHYLRNKLEQIKNQNGDNKFYSFYRNFLLKLFHQGLGEEHQQNKELIALIGNVPYLNGGLFDSHELEQTNTIQIPDEAFEKLFDFFDKYQWHLDTHSNATGNEINPDVIGYIFEKYINDRAAMGAYYTKEDITEYIGKNTIIPYLFDKTKTQCANAFKTDSSLWQLLKDDPDRYIYDAVKKGCEYDDIPENIAIGINTDTENLLERRKDWNTPTPEKFALPTEIWRETIARRQRYVDIKTKLENGDITDINNLITYNLNIRQFAQDALAYYEGSDFIEAFYSAIESITILDPTCGSGAFLFAALNILEPLYEGCLNRMREFINDAPDTKYKNFRLILNDVDNHTNPTYWIYKKIILKNLHGVDIMQEAVEIAKLRLFLKLAAMAEVNYKKPNMGLEPLPDIDFNIRCGNALIGYITHKQIKTAVEYDVSGQAKLFVSDAMILIDTMIEELQGVLRRYQTNQLENNTENLHQDKIEIKDRLAEIQEQLDFFLARDYGIATDNKKKMTEWKQSHQPFHWFTEFFHIMNQGGFDVIIGNPPYVEYSSKLRSLYSLKGYKTEKCGNLHAYIAERCFKLNNLNGLIGLIVPLPAITTSRMEELQKLINPLSSKNNTRTVWISAFDERPSSLFTGVDQRLIIEIIGRYTSNLYTTGINRWASATREFLLETLDYTNQESVINNYTSTILKIKNNIEFNILKKLYKNNPISYFKSEQATKNKIHYRTAGGRYWKVILNKEFGTNTASEKWLI